MAHMNIEMTGDLGIHFEAPCMNGAEADLLSGAERLRCGLRAEVVPAACRYAQSSCGEVPRQWLRGTRRWR